MAYDLLVKDARVIDGSGMPSFSGDIGVKHGRIVATGKLTGQARRTLNAGGLAVSPGVIDNHCHYDGQVTWDPLCTFSCYHGATTVIIGNCSLALAPARASDRDALASMLAHVEAIPFAALQKGVSWDWETIPEYYDALDRRLGVNVACFVGHSAVRRYVMQDAAYDRQATAEEMERMLAILRGGMEAGALGISFERNRRHVDLEGRLTPTNVASDEELLTLAGWLGRVGAGVIQFGGGNPGLSRALAESTGRPVVYGGITQRAGVPDQWKTDLAYAEATSREGIRYYPLVNPRPGERRFTLQDAQHFNAMATWKTVMSLPLEERKQAFADPAVRAKLHFEAVETPPNPNEATDFSRRWDLCFVMRPALPAHQGLRGKTITELAREQGKDIIAAFLDLALAEDLETVFGRRESNIDEVAMTALLTSPYTVIGLSDGGAHVVFESDYSYATYLLGHWVREKGILSLEEAIRKISFVPASVFGLHDRGLLQPGMQADMMVFDPATIAPLEPEEVWDLPGGAMRRKQLSRGIAWTVVQGEPLIDHGEHTGAFPGKVFRNNTYRAAATV